MPDRLSPMLDAMVLAVNEGLSYDGIVSIPEVGLEDSGRRPGLAARLEDGMERLLSWVADIFKPKVIPPEGTPDSKMASGDEKVVGVPPSPRGSPAPQNPSSSQESPSPRESPQDSSSSQEPPYPRESPASQNPSSSQESPFPQDSWTLSSQEFMSPRETLASQGRIDEGSSQGGREGVQVPGNVTCPGVDQSPSVPENERQPRRRTGERQPRQRGRENQPRLKRGSGNREPKLKGSKTSEEQR